MYNKNVSKSGELTTVSTGSESLGFSFNLSKNKDNSINVAMSSKLIAGVNQANGVQAIQFVNKKLNFVMTKESNTVYYTPLTPNKSVNIDTSLSNYNTYKFNLKYLVTPE